METRGRSARNVRLERAARSQALCESGVLMPHQAEIAEAHRSADVFAEVQEMTAPLNAFLSLIHAIDWLDVKAKADKTALRAFFDGSLAILSRSRSAWRRSPMAGQRLRGFRSCSQRRAS
jgi:hypothetical protein